MQLLDNIEKLEPFGVNNPEPKFIIKNVLIVFAKLIKEKHLLITINNNSNISINGICFNCIDDALGQNLLNHKSKKFDIGCSLKKNTYKAGPEPQLIVHDAIINN